LICKKF